jgi:tetrahydromethanopterin S-methyltransferase subunit H
MKRMTLKSAAEIIADRRLTNRLNVAMFKQEIEAKRHADLHASLVALALRRNKQLARSEDTSEVDAQINTLLIACET